MIKSFKNFILLITTFSAFITTQGIADLSVTALEQKVDLKESMPQKNSDIFTRKKHTGWTRSGKKCHNQHNVNADFVLLSPGNMVISGTGGIGSITFGIALQMVQNGFVVLGKPAVATVPFNFTPGSIPFPPLNLSLNMPRNALGAIQVIFDVPPNTTISFTDDVIINSNKTGLSIIAIAAGEEITSPQDGILALPEIAILDPWELSPLYEEL